MAVDAVKPKPATVGLLPTAPTKKVKDLNSFSILLYGAPKVGKSTLASQFPHAVFLATEAGLNALEVYQVPVDSWDKFLDVMAEIAKGQHSFQTIVVDTVGNLFKFCSDFICKKMGIKHESDLEWGKGYSLVRDEFLRVVTKLTLLPYGVVFIGHADTIEIKSLTGAITKSVPQLNKSARDILIPIVDFLWFCSIEQTPNGYERVIHTKPTENWDAGDRTGKMPSEIPMRYEALIQAFQEAIAE